MKHKTILSSCIQAFMAASMMSTIVPGHEVHAEDHFSRAKTKHTEQLQNGLAYTHAVYGEKDPNAAGYMVDAAFTKTKKEADELQNELAGKGYAASVKTVAERAQDDPLRGTPLGYLVRTGPFQKETDAKSEQKKLVSAGYNQSKVVYIPEDGEEATGPWTVSVLEVSPEKWRGEMEPSLANGIVPGREKLTDMAAKKKAIAGINGGYFVMGSQDGTEGDLAGVSVINGELISEAVKGRTSLLIGKDNTSKISSVRTKLTVKGTKGMPAELDGLNRDPGRIRGCGGVGDLETSLPKHDFTCTDEDELIQYNSVFGKRAPEGPGAEAVMDSTGRVVTVHKSRGADIPFGGSVVAGTGQSAAWLQEHAVIGKKLHVGKMVFADNKPVPASKKMGIINGGPRLLKNGKVFIDATKEGFHQPDDPEFFYRFGERRNPRTIAGIKPNGNILLVTVDGRSPGYSIGMNFDEEAHLMKSLGAVDAVNLDGGGSTGMVMNSRLVTDPSDAAGERPIGDGILLVP